MAGKNVDDKLRCSFCNKTQNQVKKLIAGPNGAYICDECVGICSEILDEEFLDDDKMDESDAGLDINLLKPKEIKEFLDDYVNRYVKQKREAYTYHTCNESDNHCLGIEYP